MATPAATKKFRFRPAEQVIIRLYKNLVGMSQINLDILYHQGPFVVTGDKLCLVAKLDILFRMELGERVTLKDHPRQQFSDNDKRHNSRIVCSLYLLPASTEGEDDDCAFFGFHPALPTNYYPRDANISFCLYL
ncbi:hypothetical protein I7I51_01913 [Histoplasma capsulatum]|uniref:Uncharacterized protein n=1 Tax=Ajellomyces capsulatus TaxID=5037 RepID=A0A8A1MFZ0_AJECA|nr:hypothetical protein I7I51_01913 [Histoplasma capsulatum]